jgi:hypothetical protein
VLELHGIVEARRGQGGGLFIGRPNPEFALSSAIQFLRADRGLNNKAATLHRRLFESIAQLGTLRAANEQRQAFAELASAETADVSAVLDQFIAMAGNRVLALFAAIAGRLIENDYSGSSEHLTALAQAVSESDASRARRIIGDYLGASGPANTRSSSDA